MSVSEISSAEQIAAHQTAVHSPKLAKSIVRADELAAILTNDNNGLAERINAFTDLHRLVVGQKLAGASREDLQAVEKAYKSTLVQKMQRLQGGMSKAWIEASEKGEYGPGAAVAYCDTLSAEDQGILFAALNAPCYNDAGRIGLGEPPQPFKSAKEWRETYLAAGEVYDYRHKVENATDLSDAEKARRDQLKALTPTYENSQDGSWARAVRKLLAEPIDRVDLSTDVRDALRPQARGRLDGKDVLDALQIQTSGSIALQLLKGSILDISA